MTPNFPRELNITKFILRASLLALALLVAVAFVLVRRDSILGRDASVSEQTKSQPHWVRNGRNRTQSPSTKKRY
jgi:hypothetical protein